MVQVRKRASSLRSPTASRAWQVATSGGEPAMWGPSIVGFDSYHYTYESGREGDMPIVGFSPRKAANVLYGDGADALLANLGKYSTGKGCLYVKKLSDVNIVVLATIIETAVERARTRHAK